MPCPRSRSCSAEGRSRQLSGVWGVTSSSSFLLSRPEFYEPQIPALLGTVSHSGRASGDARFRVGVALAVPAVPFLQSRGGGSSTYWGIVNFRQVVWSHSSLSLCRSSSCRARVPVPAAQRGEGPSTFGKRGQLSGEVVNTRKVDIRLPGKGDSNSHGAKPVHQIITTIKWIRTRRLSVKNSLSLVVNFRGGRQLADVRVVVPSAVERLGTHQTVRLKLSDTQVYEPYIRALLGTASHFCEAVVL